jgi:hypothetical protein
LLGKNKIVSCHSCSLLKRLCFSSIAYFTNDHEEDKRSMPPLGKLFIFTLTLSFSSANLGLMSFIVGLIYDSRVIHIRGACGHNIIKQCVFIHVGLENSTMGCPNLVQGNSNGV